MIVHEHGKWILKTADGSRVLGTHATKEEAEAQERAVQAHKHDARVNRFERFDASALRPPVRMDNGFLKVEGRIARVGIQEYRDGAGMMRRELRLPEEVFAVDSLSSFQQVPVTNRHPPGMLTARNARQYAVGSVGENVRQDGDFVAAPLMITDDEAISAVEAGRSQLSNGYSCRLDDRDPALVSKWGEHDKIQREIRGNHCALVDTARAGAGASIRLDEGDAVTGDFATPAEPVLLSIAHEGDRLMPIKIKIDGFDIEVADDNSRSIIERAIDNARKGGLLAAETEKVRADAAEKAKADLSKTISELQAKADSLEAKAKADLAESIRVDGKDVKVVDLRDQAKFDALIQPIVSKAAAQRAALVVVAREHLGANEKLDELPDVEIKKLVVKKLDKDVKLDGKDDVYVGHRFDFEVEKAEKGKVRSIDRARTVQEPPKPADAPRADEVPTEPGDARLRMIQRRLDAVAKK